MNDEMFNKMDRFQPSKPYEPFVQSQRPYTQQYSGPYDDHRNELVATYERHGNHDVAYTVDSRYEPYSVQSLAQEFDQDTENYHLFPPHDNVQYVDRYSVPVRPTQQPKLSQYQYEDYEHDPRVQAETYPNPWSDPANVSSPALDANQRKLSSNIAPYRGNGLQPAHRAMSADRLVPVTSVAARFRTMFNFDHFNAVQSRCFDHVYGTDDNVVLSAPTGSGKTVVLELAVCRLLEVASQDCFKVVYMAPTRALCSERCRDWQAKFRSLSIRVEELTGESDTLSLRALQEADFLVTTPEKWDSVTRRKDHTKLLQLIRLFLIDEVHILSKDRGAALEAVVTRMKSFGADIRFIALSATIPNSQDIATWLGRSNREPKQPAIREELGEEFRPVPLQRHVCGYESKSNDFSFDAFLNAKLTDVIKRYTIGRPIIVFCFTRASCKKTAETLSTWWASLPSHQKPWPAPTRSVKVQDDVLKPLVPNGVAVHHAGLVPEDRAAIEGAYLSGQLSAICCTSTLAMGVNLPCHMVIIKGTATFDEGSRAPQELSDAEVLQMIGRAGRPQFDDSAIAVIMTKLQHVDRYKKMVTGQEILESRLHLNLIEHFNAEIGLGTITDVASSIRWLSSTFMYVRLMANPQHYRIEGDPLGGDIHSRLDSICGRAIDALQENELVQGHASGLQSTKYGDAMARYYVKYETMLVIMSLPSAAKISDILSSICQAHEFRDMRFKSGEKQVYKEVNKATTTRFPIKVDLALAAHKVSLIIQAVLGGTATPLQEAKHRFQFNLDQGVIFQHARRLIRCVVDCQAEEKDSVATRNALMLVRSLGAKIWDDSPLHLEQLTGIGPAAARRLINANISSIAELAATEPHRIEMALSKQAPFGLNLVKQASTFPQLRLKIGTSGPPAIVTGQHATLPITVDIGFVNAQVPVTFQKQAVYVCVLAESSDGRLLHFGRISAQKLGKGQSIKFEARIESASQVVVCYVACDELAGTLVQQILRPNLPASAFPVVARDTGKYTHANDSSKSHTKQKRLQMRQVKRLAPESSDEEYGEDDLDAAEMVRLETAVARSTKQRKDLQGTKTQKDRESVNKQIANTSWQPERLPNGNWKCSHKCKDRDTCKHKCCREGLENKPKPIKQKVKGREERSAGTKSTQTRLKGSKMQDIETIDLSRKTPVREKELLRTPQTKIEQLQRLPGKNLFADPLTNLARKSPDYTYASGTRPRLSFLDDHVRHHAAVGPGESRNISTTSSTGLQQHEDLWAYNRELSDEDADLLDDATLVDRSAEDLLDDHENLDAEDLGILDTIDASAEADLAERDTINAWASINVPRGDVNAIAAQSPVQIKKRPAAPTTSEYFQESENVEDLLGALSCTKKARLDNHPITTRDFTSSGTHGHHSLLHETLTQAGDDSKITDGLDAESAEMKAWVLANFGDCVEYSA